MSALPESSKIYGTTETYTNDSGDKLTQVAVSGVPVKTFSYDNAGRTTGITTSGGTTTFAYDFESRVTGITYPNSSTNSFAYNGFDTRVSKVDSSGASTYRRAGAAVTAPVLGDGSASYTPGLSERRGSATTFLHSGIKNADAQSGSAQTLTATRIYDAFGNLDSSTGTFAGYFGYGGGFGYQSDSDSSLELLGHRYYDASTGRFLTRDPIKDGRNWYAYCGNGPVGLSDPLGNRAIFIGFSTGGIFGLVGGGASYGIVIDPDNGFGIGGGVDLGVGAGLALPGPGIQVSYDDQLTLGSGIENWVVEDQDQLVQLTILAATFTAIHDGNGHLVGGGGGGEFGSSVGAGTLAGVSYASYFNISGFFDSCVHGAPRLTTWNARHSCRDLPTSRGYGLQCRCL